MKKLIFTTWILVLAVVINLNKAEGEWISIGPNGDSIVASGSYENIIFIATEEAIYRSLNNGINWEFVYHVPPSGAFRISSIAVTPDKVFAVMFWGMVSSTNYGNTWNELNIPGGPLNVIKSINGILYLGGYNSFLYRSTNNGVIWYPIITQQFDFISDIISKNSYTFVASNLGLIYKGNDENWSLVLDSLYNLKITKLESNESFIFASAHGKGILRSGDDGNTWEYANGGLTNLYINTLKYFDSKLFAATDDGVFYSADNGNSWIRVSNGLPHISVNNLFTGNASLFAGCSTEGIYKTTDYGNYWSEANNEFTGKTITSITSNNQYLFAGTMRGELYRSSNHGTNWTSINNGIQNKGNPQLLVNDNYIFCGTSGSANNNMYRSSDNGDNWELKADGLSNSVNGIAVTNTDIFAATSSGVYTSSNNGDNWVDKHNGLPLLNYRGITSIFSDGNYLYIGVDIMAYYPVIYLSTNNGNNWILKSNGFEGFLTGFAKIANYVFAVSSTYYSPFVFIFRSSDNGENWISYSNGFIGKSANSIHATGDYILAASDSGFFYSYDYGLSWYRDNDGFNKNKEILELYSDQDQIFAGLSSGAVWTKNVSVLPVELASFSFSAIENTVTLNWQTNTELNNSGFDIERSIKDNKWIKAGFVQGSGNSNEPKDYSFTDKNIAPGKYKYRLKQIDFNGNFEYFNLTGEVIIGVPDKYELSQNYPNPFNPITVIRYSLTENNFTSLKIYDVTGREITKLVNEKQEAGIYEVILNGSNFASGVYFYELRSGEFISQRRMLLLK